MSAFEGVFLGRQKQIFYPLGSFIFLFSLYISIYMIFTPFTTYHLPFIDQIFIYSPFYPRSSLFYFFSIPSENMIQEICKNISLDTISNICIYLTYVWNWFLRLNLYDLTESVIKILLAKCFIYTNQYGRYTMYTWICKGKGIK